MPGPKRKGRVKEQLDNLPTEKLRMCLVKAGCDCTGCVNALGIKSSELKWYKDNYIDK